MSITIHVETRGFTQGLRTLMPRTPDSRRCSNPPAAKIILARGGVQATDSSCSFKVRQPGQLAMRIRDQTAFRIRARLHQ